MSNTPNRITGVPSWISIVSTAVIAGVAAASTGWILTADPVDTHHLVGVALGMVATLALALQAIGRMIRRRETGVWLDPDGRPLLVRLDDWPPGRLVELGRILAELENRGWHAVPGSGTDDIRHWTGVDRETSVRRAGTRAAIEDHTEPHNSI